MNSAPAPKSVLELILDWSRSGSRPLWQRDALRRIVAAGTLEDIDIVELVLLCKKGKGDTTVTASPILLAEEHLPASPGTGQDIALVSLSEITGVNQLAPAQTVQFEPNGLTIVYGDNGAGKSGYARILKRACRARHSGTIMPNAFDPLAVPDACATIAYKSGGQDADPVAWQDGPTPHPILSAVNVFDRECATVHVREKNVVQFRPFGLDVPDALADACQRVKNILTTEQNTHQSSRDPVFLKSTWKTSTRVGKILSSLTANTTLDELVLLADVSAEERSRYRRLCEDLAKDPAVAAAEQRLYADELSQAATGLRKMASETGDLRLQTLKGLADGAREKRRAATISAATVFSGAPIEGVGGNVWRTLWEAARDYSEHVAYVGRPFPPEDDAVCVFCQQSLSEVARSRLKTFDTFIRNNVERQADSAESALEEALKRFQGERIRVSAYSAVRQRILISNPALGRIFLQFLASTEYRRRLCSRSLSNDAPLTLPPQTESPVEKVDSLEAQTRTYATELKQAAEVEGRRLLEAERDELADRISLEELKDKVASEVLRLKSLVLIAKCISETGTTAITLLGNNVADKAITPTIRDRFHDEIVALAANKVRVEIVRSGGKFGSPHYQIKLLANASAGVGSVLSEGEQTCIAIAAFLTELATATHKSALVFDDPVSSLDHRWRRKVAERLVAEIARRQVVVFTHDLVFLNDLKDAATRENRPVSLITVSRGPSGAGVVTPGLPWLAASIQSRVDTMEKDARAAKILYESDDENGYREAAFKIYSNLRNTWERAIEDIAFHGVINRHRDYVNTKYLRKSTVLTINDCTTFDVGFEKCCDQTNAHDSSRARNAPAPPPNEMMSDVQAVLAWVQSIRDRQKAIS